MQNGSVYEGPEIWFLTGSRALYGEDTLQQVAAQSRQISDTLDAARPRDPRHE